MHDEEAAQQHRASMSHRAGTLMQQAMASPDPLLQQAALQELLSLVKQYPRNMDYRTTYAFALVASNKKEAIRQAEIAAAGAGASHNNHFNIGQIFWLAGDEERGRHYLDLALQYAENDDERQDVLDRIMDLGGRGQNEIQ